MGLFLKFIWQFGDVVEFWLWGLMLPWQQQFEGHVYKKFEFVYIYIKLDCDLGSSILVTLNTIVLRKMLSDFFG